MSDPILTPEQVEDVRLAKAFDDGIGGPEFPVVEMSKEARDALCASHEALRAQVASLTAERDALKKWPEWQPIETHDGSCKNVLVFQPSFLPPEDGIQSACWIGGCWAGDTALLPQPTHWQPLPGAPAQPESK